METLSVKTEIGTLSVMKNCLSDYPGLWVDYIPTVGDDKSEVPICNIEYNSYDKIIEVIVYANRDYDEPTHVIKIEL